MAELNKLATSALFQFRFCLMMQIVGRTEEAADAARKAEIALEKLKALTAE